MCDPQTTKFASYNWMRGVCDDTGISIGHRLVLVRICLHRGHEGECAPGYDAVADEVNVDRATVFRPSMSLRSLSREHASL